MAIDLMQAELAKNDIVATMGGMLVAAQRNLAQMQATQQQLAALTAKYQPLMTAVISAQLTDPAASLYAPIAAQFAQKSALIQTALTTAIAAIQTASPPAS